MAALEPNEENPVGREETQTAPATAESSDTAPETQPAVASEEVTDEQRPELTYPAKLTEREHEDIAAQVYPLPTEVAQQMLDVIQARIQSGPPIRTNPASVLRGILRKYHADPASFDPSTGYHIADQRHRRAEAEARLHAASEARGRAAATLPLPRPPKSLQIASSGPTGPPSGGVPTPGAGGLNQAGRRNVR